MAIAQDKTDNFDDLLTCTICLETFKGPKYLPCLHTFCKTCINTYTLSTANKGKTETTFKCPICRQDVLMGESPGNPETWAEKLPGNHFVASMMDRQEIRKSEKMCDSCKVNNKSEKARSLCTVCDEAFCSSCETYHKSFKISAKHPIISLEDVGTNKETVIVSSLIFCEEHSGEIIKAYCVDHSKPICTLCATLAHRKCDDVITIEKAVSGIKKSQKSMELSTELKDTNKKLSDLILDRKNHLTDFEKEVQAILTKVSTIKDNIIEHLNKIEEQIKDEIIKSKKETVLKLSEESTDLESLKSTVDNWIAIYDTCLQHGSELQCLLEMNRINENKKKFGDAFNKGMSEIKNISMHLEANDIAENFAKRVANIGEVKLFETNTSPILSLGKTINFHTGNINVIKCIDLNAQCVYLSGLFMKDEFIFTNGQSYKVLKFSHNGDILAELKLLSQPCDIDIINGTRVAVSCSSRTFFIINTHNMTLCHTVANTYPVHGFCHVNGEFILASSTTLTWINATTGIKTDEALTNGDSFYLYAKDRSDFICANGLNTVSRTVNNTKVFSYTNEKLSNARGISVDYDENFYICAHTSGNIHQITKDGKLIRIIPAESIGIKQPWVIRFKKNSNQFFVTCNQTGKIVVCEII
ncbi:transcription intermediary factor 1-alpha-like [Mytilus edulis]|uniref:transcription intermediary factor 1-alpha-like n=1 Tax=Mytilus edulis TaxID=6550 RepID=UPI0039EF676F